MLRESYQVPSDSKEKEKIIGGLLTINQTGWLALGFGIGAGLFMLMYSLTESRGLSLSMFVIGAVPCLPFAFFTKRELTLFQYLIQRRKFKKKTKKMPNKRSVNL